ncbi:tropinone reductase 2-like protein [Leptotrombidium deliense]|uniref:Tropinone reductase 2-like protein n=1 Tax=Leptotrombidium deliense TaxID=299467 RepID=A0A443S956_9ACAR|nr:tropinone reductase 2-like protein [Leptotrombidium deliense]
MKCIHNCLINHKDIHNLSGNKKIIAQLKSKFIAYHNFNYCRVKMQKVVIVTGSTSGIGRETAIRFARLNYHIVVNGRRAELVNEVVNECQSASNVKSIGVIADVTKAEDAKRLIDNAIEAFGRIDVLVNNAGVVALTTINDENIIDVYDKIMNTNLRAVIQLCHLSVPHLEKTKGCIVNVSSVAGLNPSDRFAMYNVSKAALDMFTKCLALELGPKGIRVNSINPAYIKTDFGVTNLGASREMMAAFEEIIRNNYPLRRVGEAEDVAKGILFLSSEDASFTTGDCLVIDGGARYANIPHKGNQHFVLSLNASELLSYNVL